jgi:hypothetical protein
MFLSQRLLLSKLIRRDENFLEVKKLGEKAGE